MFTGLIQATGTVLSLETGGLTVETAGSLELAGGDSVAVNGVCLTATAVGGDGFSADVMHETLRRSSLAGLAAGDRVNLELPLRASDRLGGHIVQGHVDGVGHVVRRTPSEHWELVEVEMPAEMAKYLVDKGSITVDGVSLTVVEAGADRFTVSLIPETLARTTLGFRGPGDRVNLEVDVIAKHVEKLVGAYTQEKS